jgi:N-acetyldiaminopimelate deacetylase
LVKVAGTDPQRCIGYRADIDGLPITEETGLDFPSQHPGQMHACGHDFHMAIALGLLTHFVQHPIADDVLFLFQPAEEGPGGAQPMLASDAFQAWRPDLIIALHIAPEYPVGTIATRPGILFANTSEMFIKLTGKSGHAAYPHQSNDMIIAASQLVSQLHTIVSRNVNPLDAAVLHLGKLVAGTKENIVASTAQLEGTIRTLSLEAMQRIKARIEAVVTGIGHSFACEAKLDWGSSYCQVENDAALARAFMDWVPANTDYQLIACSEAMTGEDFGYFLQEIPGFMFWLGVDSPFGLHHPQLAPQEEAIGVAIDLMSQYITQLAGHAQ